MGGAARGAWVGGAAEGAWVGLPRGHGWDCQGGMGGAAEGACMWLLVSAWSCQLGICMRVAGEDGWDYL